MNPFDFVDWLDENAKHMARFTLNGESLGIIREGLLSQERANFYNLQQIKKEIEG